MREETLRLGLKYLSLYKKTQDVLKDNGARDVMLAQIEVKLRQLAMGASVEFLDELLEAYKKSVV